MTVLSAIAIPLFVSFIICLESLIAPQSAKPESPCGGESARQFDFWLGDWDLTYKQRASPDSDEWTDGKASNRIERTMDGCVILENFSDGTTGAGYHGMSVSVFNERLGKWQQTWVDNQGAYLDFVGEFKDGRMVLSREVVVKGQRRLQRMVWHDITKDRLEWDWQMSRDDGATWITLWHILYTRRK